MAQTRLNAPDQILDGSITRAKLNTTTAASAVIARALAGAAIALTSTGVDAGTGDVTIALSGILGTDTAIGTGAKAPGLLVTGNNTAYGGSALAAQPTSAFNATAVGYNALALNTANQNTAVGAGAAASNVTGTGITAVGYNALTLSTGINNTAFGESALASTTAGVGGTAVGYNALTLATGNNNTAVGKSALAALTSGAGCTAVGKDALLLATGNSNTAFGISALASVVAGTANVAVGNSALTSATGSSNSALGPSAGSGLTSGSYNVILGSYGAGAAPISATGSNFIVLSDGQANVRAYWDASGHQFTSASINVGTPSGSAAVSGDCNIAGTFKVNGVDIGANRALNRAAVLTSVTTLAASTTYATGGVTLASQTLAAGAVWRIKAYGTLTSVSSATARNARIGAVWGGTLLTAHSGAVAASVAATTPWTFETTLNATSTSALWQAGYSHDAILTQNTSPRLRTIPGTPVSVTGLPTGAQTIDLQFSFSVVVAGDSWQVHGVEITRLL